MNNKRDAVIAALFEKKNRRKPKNSKELLDFIQSQGGEEFLKKVDEYIAQAEKDLALQAQKAAHGAKLQYFRNLKNQCAEDEELVYYKKGGKVDCGCQKKGGEISKEPKKQSVVDKFKAIKKAESGDTLGRILDATGSQGGFRKAKEDSKKLKKKAFEEKWKKGEVIVGKDLERGLKDTKKKAQTDSAVPNEDIPGKKTKLKKNGGNVCPKCGKVHAAGMGCLLNKSKIKVSCGSKLKKHLLGGSLKRNPFYLKGTIKLGIEKSDNTRVNRIPNNGEGVYEQMPINGWDFVPIVGTYREAQRLDREDPNASKLGLATSLGMDLLGAGMMAPALKATVKASRLSKLLKSRGFNKITEQGLYRSLPNIYMKVAPETIEHLYYRKTIPTVRFKQIPTVDVSGVALLPLVQTLRVPTLAMSH